MFCDVVGFTTVSFDTEDQRGHPGAYQLHRR